MNLDPQQKEEVLRQLSYSEHDWRKHVTGEISYAAWWTTKGKLDHGGPSCEGCGYAPCLRCLANPDTCVTVEMTCGC
jgi:hypothetical protein